MVSSLFSFHPLSETPLMLTTLLRKLAALPFFYSPEQKFASRFYDALGRIAIGDPKELGCPASFYYIQSDRPIPRAEAINTASRERILIRSDVIRRRLTDFIAKACAAGIVVLTIAWCSAALVAQLVVLGFLKLTA